MRHVNICFIRWAIWIDSIQLGWGSGMMFFSFGEAWEQYIFHLVRHLNIQFCIWCGNTIDYFILGEVCENSFTFGEAWWLWWGPQGIAICVLCAMTIVLSSTITCYGAVIKCMRTDMGLKGRWGIGNRVGDIGNWGEHGGGQDEGIVQSS